MVIINLTNSINETFTDIVSEIKRYLNNIQDKELEIENRINSNEKDSGIVIDRFESDIAVCENIEGDKVIQIKREKLPINVKEGNVLKYDNNKYVIDFNSTKLLNKNIKEITKNLWEN